MKNFFCKLGLVTLLFTAGYLGWRTRELSGLTHELRQEVRQLERERRRLRQELAVANASGSTNVAEQATARTEVERQTAALRGLSFQRPVSYHLIGRAELRAYLVQKVREQFTEQELRDYGRTLAALGLVPAGTDLLTAMLSLYDEQVAAFYVPEERALYTFKGAGWTSAVDRMLLAHELTHALQDQNFDLQKFALKRKDNDDLVLANAALIEGDATVLMTRWYGENADPAAMAGDLGAMMGQNTKALLAAPAYLREMLLFPYLAGQQFVEAVQREGGATALNEAFRQPPVSSQQILHPQMFLKNRRDPTPIDLKPLTAPGWRQIGDNVLGEFGIRTLLQEHGDEAGAAAIAQGWCGDRFQVYEHGTNGPTGLVWVSVWDTDQAAGKFTQAYTGMAQARHVNAHVQRDGRRVAIRQSADAAFFELARD